MTQLPLPTRTSFGTVGVLQRQVRQLLNVWPIPDDANSNTRPVAFCCADQNIGVLRAELDTRAWLYPREDSANNPVVVLPATSGNAALYMVANLAERATVAALAAAIDEWQIEMVVASPRQLTSHWLQFSFEDADYLDGLLAEYLDLCPAYDPQWLTAFTPAVRHLPALCQHLNPALLACERQAVIVLQGNYDNHLSAVRTAVHRF